jgi:hypothetical protein
VSETFNKARRGEQERRVRHCDRNLSVGGAGGAIMEVIRHYREILIPWQHRNEYVYCSEGALYFDEIVILVDVYLGSTEMSMCIAQKEPCISTK